MTNHEQVKSFPGNFEHILEFYKIQIQKIQKIEETIVSTNNFFLALSASIVTVLCVFLEKTFNLVPILGIGFIASCFWYFQITSLRYLRATNYATLRVIETQLGFDKTRLDKEVDTTKGWLTNLAPFIKDNHLPALLIIIWIFAFLWDVFWRK